MEEPYLYRQIADSIRSQIFSGEIKPGDRLPTVRHMMVRWNCTIGTVQRAYQELAGQGLVTSRVGQGTRVVERPSLQDAAPLRRASLIHRAETFLLEVLTAGYSPGDVEDAVRQALDRWRAVALQPALAMAQTLRFAGSHDLAVAWLAAYFPEVVPGFALDLSFTGSLGGLIALAEGKADLAGCHLWDEETDEYNVPFVRRLLPGRRVALVTLAHRRVGLIVPPGNPHSLQGLPDLARAGLRFVNRQSGSGTRVWLDAQLRRMSIRPADIQGYEIEKMTHADIAQEIAEGRADAGLGLEAVARPYGLGFGPLTQERYDLVVPAALAAQPVFEVLLAWLHQPQTRAVFASFAGYETGRTGDLSWVE
jgi:molybdate-binding protein/DNA-binding transcriptional regulator YhcF (GntR family)